MHILEIEGRSATRFPNLEDQGQARVLVRQCVMGLSYRLPQHVRLHSFATDPVTTCTALFHNKLIDHHQYVRKPNLNCAQRSRVAKFWLPHWI